MNCNLHPGQKCFLAVFGVLVTIFLVVASFNFNIPSGVQKREINNNPDKFRLWATNLSYSYTFTYDPLAADEWRFETGGFIVTNHPQRCHNSNGPTVHFRF
jgi:hypothetical protein